MTGGVMGWSFLFGVGLMIQCTTSFRVVNLDTLLHESVVSRKEGYKETLRWDEIFSRMLGKMAPAARITRVGCVPMVRKGKLEPIELAVAKRSGNKKVCTPCHS